MSLTDLERTILDTALTGSAPEFEKLKAQMGKLETNDREQTGVGFFTEFKPVDEALRAECKDFEISDVEGKMAGLDNGFGCVVFVKSGQIDTIECFSYDEAWPDQESQFELSKAPST